MKRVANIVVIIVIIVAFMFACNYAMDNDPSFSGSKTWTGHGGYNQGQ